MRIATFNLENLDDTDEGERVPSLERRIAVLRPQLERLAADVLCLQEVNAQPGSGGGRELAALDELLEGTPYAGFDRLVGTTQDGEPYAERNLVVLARDGLDPVGDGVVRPNGAERPSYRPVTADPRPDEATVVSWERPILHARTAMRDGTVVDVANVHLKSKLAANVAGQKLDPFTWRTPSGWAEGFFLSSMRRVGQALQLRWLVDDVFDERGEDAAIAVCGDFNAEEDETAMRALLGRVEDTGNLEHGPRVMTPTSRGLGEGTRFSLRYLGRGEMIDDVVVSRSLLDRLVDVAAHNEALPDESGPFRTDALFPESDHAPVVATFRDGAEAAAQTR